MPVAWKRSAFLINWLQDIYPETAIQLNVPLLRSPIGRGIASVRDRSLTVAKANVIVGKQMARQVISRKISANLANEKRDGPSILTNFRCLGKTVGP